MAKRKGVLSEKESIQFYRAQKEQCSEERKELEKFWVDQENLYLNKHDFRDKKDWQAKLFYSMTSPTTNKASRMIKQMLLRSPDYFTMDYVGLEDIKLADGFTEATKFYLNDGKFPERFAEGCGSGFNYAIGILKMFGKVSKNTVVVNGKKNTRSITKLVINTLNPWHCYWPKDWGCFIEDTWTTVPQLLQNAKNGQYDFGKKGSGLRRVKKILGKDYKEPGDADSEAQDIEEARLNRLGIKDHLNKYRKALLISTYWGPIINKKGVIVATNQKMMMVNDRYILQPHMDNPFGHQQWPYIFINPLPVLFRHFGEGLTWGVNPVQKEMTNMLNLMSDSLKFNMVGVIEANESMLVNPKKPMELYPGCTVRTRGDARQRALEFHPLGKDPDVAAGFITLLRTIHQNHTGVTDYLMGAPTMKGSPTATEVATKTTEGQAGFEAIAEDIDRQGIVGAAEMAKDLIIQYFADVSSYPNVQRIFEDATGTTLMNLTDAQKAEMLHGDWDVQARGLGLFFERREQIQKLARWIDGMSAVPPEIAIPRIDWQDYVQTLSEAVWGDRDRMWKKDPPQQGPMGPPQLEGGGEIPLEMQEGVPTLRLPFGGGEG